MTMRCKNGAIFSAALIIATVIQPTYASPIFSVSPTVTTVDRIATFDVFNVTTLYTGFYSENLLYFNSPINLGAGCCNALFAPGDTRDNGYYYGNGGSISFVQIKGTDGGVFSAVDLLLGDGEAPPATNVQWKTFLRGGLTGSGFFSSITKGTTIGWMDPTGFDELLVAASSGSAVGLQSPDYRPGFGKFQSIALDDVRAQLAPPPPPPPPCCEPPPPPPPPSEVPEPPPLGLIGIAMASIYGLLLMRRQQAMR